MKIEIDKSAGFCFGVVNAIKKAEDLLKNGEKLYCLGLILHNSTEVDRLKKMGLITINYGEFKKLKNSKVLIRAHGEPPETYIIAEKNNIDLIDASCPVVLKLQNNVSFGYMETENKGGQVVIYGKKGHAEVNGLNGQIGNNAIIIESLKDINKIDVKKPIRLFSQTTRNTFKYRNVINMINTKIKNEKGTDDFKYYHTICKQVANREPELKHFASLHDIMIFASDKKSSNGKMLYKICKSVNNNTYFVSNVDDLDFEWFDVKSSVGISGATSTPMWVMEEIYNKLNEKFN